MYMLVEGIDEKRTNPFNDVCENFREEETFVKWKIH